MRGAFWAFGLLVAGSAAAVTMSANGSGQLLIYPYYTVNCYVVQGDYCYPRPPDYTRAHINIMRPDVEGRQYLGVPVVGFAATGYINAYAGKAGVFRNFTFAVPYGRRRACVQHGVVGGCH